MIGGPNTGSEDFGQSKFKSQQQPAIKEKNEKIEKSDFIYLICVFSYFTRISTKELFSKFKFFMNHQFISYESFHASSIFGNFFEIFLIFTFFLNKNFYF